jgi:serpin B
VFTAVQKILILLVILIWVARATNATTANVLYLKPEMAIILANAVYFLGDWQYQFLNNGRDEENRKRDFTTLAGDVTRPVFMNYAKERQLRYFEDESLQAVELPYKANERSPRLAMTIYLPKAKDGLPSMEAGLTAEKIASIRGQLATPVEGVQVNMPKWEVKSETMKLQDTLKKMGMSLAFNSDNADFTGMTPRGIALELVIHKTFIKVDEKGTEAAAVTTVGGLERSTSVNRPRFPKFVHADHPFLYTINDTETGAILFLGRMLDPTKAD